MLRNHQDEANGQLQGKRFGSLCTKKEENTQERASSEAMGHCTPDFISLDPYFLTHNTSSRTVVKRIKQKPLEHSVQTQNCHERLNAQRGW